jgi:tetratricopeptide (TPR) repeat protein
VIQRILLLFVLLPVFALAQKEGAMIDSLKKRLRTPKNDSDRSFVMDKLAKEYFDTNLDSSLLYGKGSLAYAKKVKLAEYEVDANNSLGIATRKKGDFRGALQFHEEALRVAKEHKLGPFYFQAIYSCICLVYTEQGNYTPALEFGYKALHEVEKQKDTLNMAVTNNNIADIYFHIKQYPKALQHYKKALEYALQLHNRYGEGLLTGNIGSVYFEMNKLDSAKAFFEKAILIQKEVSDVFGEASNLQNVGSYYQKKGASQRALEYFEAAEKLFRENELYPDLATAYFNIASCYQDRKDYQKSKIYAEKSLKIAEKINSYPHKQSAHEALKNALEKLHDIPGAYHHYQEYIAARDSIFNQDNRKAQFKTELEYEYTKKRDIDSLNQVVTTKIQQEQLQQEQLRTQTQRKFTYTAMAGCLVLLVLVIFIFKGYRDKQKANQIITAQKREVELQKEIIEEKQKEILDSIHYAKRIQQSLLPNEKYIERNLQQLVKRKK